MTIYGTIVVGIDGSEVAKDALHWAAAEADRRASKLLVVHVADGPPEGVPHTNALEVHNYADILRTEAVTTVAGAHPNLECELVITEGHPADALISMSGETDLLVVGTHRTGRLRGFVLGSVSQRVAAHAKCPVVTISGPTSSGEGTLVLGASGSTGGLAALRFACEEARVRHMPVHAVRAMSVEDWALPGIGYPMAMSIESLDVAARGQLDAVLKTATAEYPDVDVIGTLTNKDPFMALLEATEGAALVVVGTRRAEDTALFHLGPVAAWLLHQAQCPLVVVPFQMQPEAALAGSAEAGGSA